ncbi:MAG: sarcosine oxidase subunit gamma [Burkholderiales bacterium]
MMLSLRGADPHFFDACERALGARPPTTPNTVASTTGAVIFWLGPDEWLYDGAKMVTVTNLRAALAGVHSAVVDVSASRKTILVAGERAETVMARAATLDFSLASFPVGTCAQTNIARTQGLIYRRGAQEFLIYVRPSFERYLRAWLADAARD